MSDEELRKLEKEVREQDQLLTGYQQENERLYGDLKDAQVKSKTAESQMFKENQKLGKLLSLLGTGQGLGANQFLTMDCGTVLSDAIDRLWIVWLVC